MPVEFFNRNIPDECHQQMQNLSQNGAKIASGHDWGDTTLGFLGVPWVHPLHTGLSVCATC
jgi:hypothetical protein